MQVDERELVESQKSFLKNFKKGIDKFEQM